MSEEAELPAVMPEPVEKERTPKSVSIPPSPPSPERRERRRESPHLEEVRNAKVSILHDTEQWEVLNSD